jgi:hypothetical protein
MSVDLFRVVMKSLVCVGGTDMCWVCDHPGSTGQDYLQYLRGLLDQHCWIVIGVQRDRYRPPYSYTVGLADHGQPELVVTGLPQWRASDLLNDVAAHLLHAEAPKPGEQIPLTGGPLIEIVRVTEPLTHLRIAAQVRGARFGALQLVYADDRGHWPWERGFRGGRGGQPVLGPRSVEAA